MNIVIREFVINERLIAETVDVNVECLILNVECLILTVVSPFF